MGQGYSPEVQALQAEYRLASCLCEIVAAGSACTYLMGAFVMLVQAHESIIQA